MVKASFRCATACFCAALCLLAATRVAAQSNADGRAPASPNGEGSDSSSASPASVAGSGAAAAYLQPEAPSSLFQASLGGEGADAELLVKGTWEASMLGTLDLQSQDGSALGLATTQPLLFTQNPELYLKFLLFKRFFVEARVSNDVTQALYAVGYQGAEGELLQELRLGNNKISFPELPFLSFGDGSYRSFGAMARIDSGDFEGRAMVRYDQADRVTKHFVGSSEVTDTVIAANAFITGKYFATSGVPGSNFAVYVQSVGGTLSDGGGTLYRKLDGSEYSYSALTGLLTLNSVATTRVAVTWTGIAPTTPVTIGGVACDLLYYPDYRAPSTGDLDPLREILARYATTADPNSATVFVRNTASGLKDTGYETRIDSAGFVEVTTGGQADPQNSAYRQPFNSMAWIYTTDFSSTATKTYAPIFDHEIVVRSYGSPGYITVDKDLVPGSVEVYRNGAPEYAFSVDQENGRLILASPPGLAEEITVSYLVETAERRAGSLVAGLGGIWTPSKEQSMWTALGLRWSVPGSSFATGGLSNPGTVTFTAGEKKAAGDFQHSAALAATYTQEEASGRYRMEGMEADSGYITGFRPAVGWTGTLEQIVDTAMSTSFPTITNQLHADGSTQLALNIVATSIVPQTLDISKVETLPPYQNFKTLTFYVNKADSGLDTTSLTLSIDDGSSSDTFISATVPFVDLSMGWNKILVHYGTSDLRVYHQSSENGPIQASSGPSATLDQSYSSGSRIHITSSGLVAADSFWVDEVILEDSVGVAAANFQGSLSYTDASFKLGSGKMPILSGITLKADSSAAYSNDSFISGGGSVNTILGPLGLGLHARGAASQSSNPAFSGGHELILPAAASPVKVDDKFDFDPSTGAFGREDTVTLGVARISALNLFQRSSWVPGSDSLSGSLAQDWKGSIGFANGRIVSSLDASNRASPPAVSVGTGYGNAWLSGFSYVLPSYEGDSELRSEKLGLKLRLSPDAEFLSGSIGTSAQPQSLTAAGTGLHEDSATLRLTAPLSFNRLKVAPYYQRSWSDQRDGSAGDMGGDASLALGDFSGLPLLYRNAPISELWDASASTSFASQTTVNGVPLSSAAYTPEAGVILSRDFGSNWYDLIEPSALSFAFRRLLVRSDASISDAAVWDATAKFAAVNLFGSEGAYPLGLPFDSDEYYVTIQTTISKYVGESTDRIGIQTQHLATLYAGASDSLSAENRFSLSTQPAQSQWSEYVQLDLTRTIRRSWLLSIYRLLVPERAAAVSRDADASGETGTMSTSPDQAEPETAPAGAKGISIASLYLQDIATRIPTLRASLEVTASLSNTITDAAAPPLSWAFGESYVSKLTVPERLTLSAKGGLSQQFDGSTGLLIFDITLGIEAIISF